MKIIVYKNKHSDEYYAADTAEQIRASMLMELRTSRQGYFRSWGDMPAPSEEDALTIALTDEEVNALPEPFKADAMRARARHARRVREHEQWDRLCSLVDALLALPYEEAMEYSWPGLPGANALDELRQERQDHEYESYEIIAVTDAVVRRGGEPQ